MAVSSRPSTTNHEIPHPDKQISQTAPDARLLKTHHMERQVCYNVQTAVDTKHHLITHHDIVMTTDRGQLTLVAQQVQQAMKKKDIIIIADKGYFSRIDIKTSTLIISPVASVKYLLNARLAQRTRFGE
jgi:hypothetical protein